MGPDEILDGRPELGDTAELNGTQYLAQALGYAAQGKVEADAGGVLKERS